MQGDNVQLFCISMRTNGIINMQHPAVSNSNDHFKEQKNSDTTNNTHLFKGFQINIFSHNLEPQSEKLWHSSFFEGQIHC